MCEHHWLAFVGLGGGGGGGGGGALSIQTLTLFPKMFKTMSL